MDAKQKDLFWSTPCVNKTAAIVLLDFEHNLGIGLPSFEKTINGRVDMFFRKSPGLFEALSLIDKNTPVPISTFIEVLRVCRGKMLEAREAKNG